MPRPAAPYSETAITDEQRFAALFAMLSPDEQERELVKMHQVVRIARLAPHLAAA